MLVGLLQRTGRCEGSWEARVGRSGKHAWPKKTSSFAPSRRSLQCFNLQPPDHDYLLILLLKSNTRRFTIQIEVTHQFITHHHEYQLAATEGVRADCAPSEFFPRRGEIVHDAIGNERADARARGAARIPPVRPHYPQGRAHRIRHQVPADRGPQSARV